MIKKALVLLFILILISLVSLINNLPGSQTISTLQAVNNEQSANQVQIMLTGDIMLGRLVMATSLDKNNPTYPFLQVADTLNQADIVFVNLENPIVENCPRHESGFKFCTDPKMTDGLVAAGIDVVNLANNHSANYGEEGLTQTINYLNQKGIQATGLGKLVKIEVKETTFGFLGFDKSGQVSPFLTLEEKELIKQSDPKVDVLIVAMHWGKEYQGTALPNVRTLGKSIVGLGADVIVGHHPHWVQNWEAVNDKPIYYSLGNFIFDTLYMKDLKRSTQGLLVELVFDGNKIVTQKFLDTKMLEVGQPQLINNN